MLAISFGDLLLDVVVRLQQPLAHGADASSRVVLLPGGQAANVAAWVAELGGRSRFVGKRGDDDAGRIVATRLAALGVEVAGPVERGATGVVVSLVEPSGERSMCSDRGVASSFRPDELDPAWLAGCEHLHVSGYALLREPVCHTAARAIELARSAGTRVSVDLSSWSAIRDFGPPVFRALVESLAPDAVFANEDEDAILGGPIAGTSWILKRGAAGCSVDGRHEQAPAVAQVVDTTGAGDAFAAGWILGGPELALEAAARCVQTPGAMPPPSER